MAAGGGGGGGGGGGSAGGSRGGRLCEAMGGLPLVTLVLLVVNVAVFVCQYLGDFNEFVGTAAISPVAVLYFQQWWRIVTAAFTHGGLMHIGMNMMTLVQLGMGVETLFGSLAYAFIILVFLVATGLLYVVMAWVASWVYPAALFSSAVGFSGVLFAMAVDEASLSPFPTRSVFGLFSVPTRVYPWVLMVLIQFMLPNVSMMGHLAGALVGFIHTWGGFQWLLPTLPALRRLEAAPCMARIVRSRPYKLLPATEVLREASSFGTQMRALGAGVACICAPVVHVVRSMCGGRWGGSWGGGGGGGGRGGSRSSEPGDAGAASAPAPAGAAAPAPPTRSVDTAAMASLPEVPSAVDEEEGGGSGRPPSLLTDAQRRDRAAMMAAAARARLAAAAATGSGGGSGGGRAGGTPPPAATPSSAAPPAVAPAPPASPATAEPGSSLAGRILGSPGARGYRAVPGADPAPAEP